MKFNVDHRPGSDGRIRAQRPQMIEHTTGTSLINFKPIPAQYEFTISNLTTGTQYEIEIRTIASGGSDLDKPGFEKLFI